MSDQIKMTVLVSRSGASFVQTAGQNYWMPLSEAADLHSAGQAQAADAAGHEAILAELQRRADVASESAEVVDTEETGDELTLKPVESLGLDESTTGHLKAAGLATIAEVVSYASDHDGDFSGVDGIGKVGSRKINAALAKLAE